MLTRLGQSPAFLQSPTNLNRNRQTPGFLPKETSGLKKQTKNKQKTKQTFYDG
jgi:hypothetical protein